MRPVIAVVLVILAAVAQATFNPQIRVLGGEPDLVLMFTLLWATRAELQEGVLLAFVGGISLDLMSAAPLGLTIIPLLLVVFGLDYVREQLFGVGIVTLLIFVIGGTLALKLISLFGLALVGIGLAPVQSFTYTILPTLVYNLAILLPGYAFVRWVQGRVTSDK
jgi:rod shape-determining protein MreD